MSQNGRIQSMYECQKYDFIAHGKIQNIKLFSEYELSFEQTEYYPDWAIRK